MYKVAIFDLDGTLADSVESIAFCSNRALEEHGLKAHPVNNYKHYAGDGAEELIRRCVRDAGDKELKSYEEVLSAYRRYFKKDCMYHVTPYEGIIETLASLKEKGMKIAVLSNKPHARTIDVVEALFGKGYFDYIQGHCDLIEKKPSPKGAWAIADFLHADPSECIYIGDTDTDMKTGKAAGMFTIGVLWGFRERKELEENKADMIIVHPREILDIADMK